MSDGIQEIRNFLSKGYYSSSDSADIEFLLTELDAAKAEAEQQRQIRYNATEANANNLAKQAEEIERLRGAMDDMFKNREQWRESHMVLQQENAELSEKILEQQNTITEFSRQYDKLLNDFKCFKETAEETLQNYIYAHNEIYLLHKALERIATEKSWGIWMMQHHAKQAIEEVYAERRKRAEKFKGDEADAAD